MNKKKRKIQEIKERCQSNFIDPDPSWPPEVQRVLECIHRHCFDQHLSVSWLKEQCRINGNNFSGKFKYYIGKPPKQYWLEHQIAVAKQLLKEESLLEVEVLKIAYELGFRSHSSFSTTFKNHVGCTPSEFRNENCGGNI